MADTTVKPERPGGFLDFLPNDYLAREKMLNTIENVFRSFGFDPIETPRVEFLKTLAGETSDTGKNIFHIKSTQDDEPLALPFDHTVPFARILAANPYEAKRKTGIRLPFRRMVVGPVFRADTPQSGRFRQFYQFDADIAGTASMLADAEIVTLMYLSIKALGIDRFRIRLNNRKILNGLAALTQIKDRGSVTMDDITNEMMRILDKRDKIGMEKVFAELSEPPQGTGATSPALSPDALENVRAFLLLDGSNAEKLDQCRAIFKGVAIAEEGIDELQQILALLAAQSIPETHIEIDFSIARGLDYYTGPVMEMVLLDAPEFGSVFSGGRYNNLVSRFTGKELPSVGASIGVDRLFAALDHLGAVDRSEQTVSKIMVLRISKAHDLEYFQLMQKLRACNVNAELCLSDDTTFKKQFNFAISRGVKYVVICGENEFEAQTLQIKNLETRMQEEIPLANLASYFQD